jgi:hypothetical protein
MEDLMYTVAALRKWLFLLATMTMLALASLLPRTAHIQAESGGDSAPVAAESIVNNVAGEGIDYATTLLGKPWNMSSIKDIYNEKTQNINSANGVNRMAIEDGALVGTSTTDDPYFFLVWGGYDHYQNALDSYGMNTPIDASYFRFLVIRMYLSEVAPFDGGRVFWARDRNLQEHGMSRPFPLQAGWFTYVVDLATIGVEPGGIPWSGPMQVLRLDPSQRANTHIKIEWVRLVAEEGLPTHEVTWSEREGRVSLYATRTPAPDRSTPIVADLDAQAGSFSWPAGLLEPGTYYIYKIVRVGAEVMESFSDPVLIREAPRAAITAPSRTSGADYATTMLNDPWDMCNSTDISHTNEIETLFFENCIAYYTDDLTTHPTTPPTGDPQLTLRTVAVEGHVRTPIDTVRYRYLTYRYKENRTKDTLLGSINRFVFWPDIPQNSTALEAEVTNEGWETYSIDLARTADDPATPSPWTQAGYVGFFRFDPNEFPGERVSGELDYVLLTSQPWADQSYVIQWSHTGGDPGATVHIYADNDLDPINGKLFIGQTILNTGAFLWNTSDVPEGDYYIYLEMRDGASATRGQYSNVPVIVNRQESINFGSFSRDLDPPSDFASQLGNSWDFDGPGDLDRRLLPTGYSGLSNVSVQNGILSARTTDDDPQFFLNMPGGAVLDTGKFNKLSVRMFSGRTDGIVDAQLHWFRTDGSIGSSAFIPIYPGWNTYTLDLAATPGWTGTIQYLRFDPAAAPGLEFSLDWVRLTEPTALNLAWQFSGTGAQVSLDAVSAADTTQSIPVARNLTGTSYIWDYGALLPGVYRLVARTDDRVSDISETVTCLVVRQHGQGTGQQAQPDGTQDAGGFLETGIFLPVVFNNQC